MVILASNFVLFTENFPDRLKFRGSCNCLTRCIALVSLPWQTDWQTDRQTTAQFRKQTLNQLYAVCGISLSRWLVIRRESFSSKQSPASGCGEIQVLNSWSALRKMFLLDWNCGALRLCCLIELQVGPTRFYWLTYYGLVYKKMAELMSDCYPIFSKSSVEIMVPSSSN